MTKKILIIYAHPKKTSFCYALGKNYLKGCKESGNKIKEIHLYDLKFETRFYGYKENIENFEDDLKQSQELILWADHITFVYPIWWFNFPSILKSFFERVMTPGFAFKYVGTSIPQRFLKGKTARVIATMDGPVLFYKHIINKPDYYSLKNNLLFCGISTKKFNYFGSIVKSDENKRKKWLEEVYKIGLKE